jgi:hypothetical protein
LGGREFQRGRRPAGQEHRAHHQPRREGGGILLKEKIAGNAELEAVSEFIHFACTSEDINNLAYALMLREARTQVLLPQLDALIDAMTRLARQHADQPMLARTHGQPASPTTLGKEMANVAYRLKRQRAQLAACRCWARSTARSATTTRIWPLTRKWTGRSFARRFVTEDLGLDWNPYTIQIEPHDYMAEFFHAVMRANTVLLDFCRDCGAISPSAISGRKPWPAKSAPRPCRTRSTRSISRTPKAIWVSPTRCSIIWPPSCRCRAGSAI